MKKILVSGANTGIGFALSKQLAVERDCHVFLGARSAEKGHAAVSEISAAISSTPGCKGSCEFIKLDVSDDSSVNAAAEEAKSKLSGEGKLYAIVNNAGIYGGNEDGEKVLNTNLYGPKRVNEAFLDLLDSENGRIVNVGSGSGPMHVRNCNAADKKILSDPNSITWKFIEQYIKKNVGRGDNYGLSKALLAGYTGIFAREHPNLKVSTISPGFIDTNMTRGWGATKTPEEGTVSIMHCLFNDLEGNGWSYGSDGIRSPLHFLRNPGEPAYDGKLPF